MFETLLKGILEGAGGSQGAGEGGAQGGDIIRVRATAGSKDEPVKKKGCCGKN